MHFFKVITLLLLATLLCAGDTADFEADTSKGKTTFVYVVKPPKSNTLSLDVIINPAYLEEPDKEPAIDILLLIDNTGSMGHIINMIKGQIDEISSFLLASYPNVHIAVASIAEHSPQKTHDAYRVIQAFTNDPVLLKKNIASLRIDPQTNNDIEEPYLYGLSRSLELEWRDESQKIVFFIGDSWAREPDEGFDKTLNTQDDLYTDLVLADYQERQIQICSYYSNQYRNTKKFFTTLSRKTNGFLQQIEANSDVKNDFQSVLKSMVGLNYGVNAPFDAHTTITQNANRFRFDFNFEGIALSEHNLINVQFIYNNSPIGNISIQLVPGKPWGVLILAGLLLFIISALVALVFIYRNIYTTTIIDYAYLRHYAVLLVALIAYVGILFFIWSLIDSPNFPIIWHGFWW
jgi:hypothetical protein